MTEDASREDRDQKRRRQTAEIYAALGEFVVQFEQLIHRLRSCCVFLTSHTPKHQRLMQIVFNYKTMTAEPLFRIYQAMVGEIINDRDTKLDSAEKEAIGGVLQQIDKDLMSLISKRNDHLHGTWYVGWGNESTQDWSKIGFSRFKATKAGLAPVDGPETAQEIASLSEECSRLTDYLMRFDACLTWHDGPRVAKNFAKFKVDGRTRWGAKLRDGTVK